MRRVDDAHEGKLSRGVARESRAYSLARSRNDVVAKSEESLLCRQDLLAGARHVAPLTVRTGGYPPLVKFGANFGIVERAAGSVVPVTVRAVEGREGTPQARLRTVRITDEAEIVLAYQELMRVTDADDRGARRAGEDGDWEPAPESSDP